MTKLTLIPHMLHLHFHLREVSVFVLFCSVPNIRLIELKTSTDYQN